MVSRRVRALRLRASRASERGATLFVVLPKFQLNDWKQTYENLCQFVVPRSSEVIREDPDLVLVSIKLFRNFVDEVKATLPV